MKFSYITMIILLLFLSNLTFAQNKLSSEQMETIDAIFKSYKDNPGCAIAVVKDGKTVLKKGYGMANLSYNIPVTSKTIFDIGAVAKQFTAACVFLLEQEGKLNLNDPIQNFLPSFPSYSNTPICIRNLIYDTSGLREYLATLHSKNNYLGDDFNTKDVIQLMKRHKGLNFPTGTKHAWGYTNYVILATIIEKASGKTLVDFAKEKIFNPLGMTNTFFKNDKDIIVKNRAIGYQNIENTFKEFHYYNHAVIGAGGLHTNIEDFIKWSNNLKTGKVGGKQFIKRMTTPGRLIDGKETLYAGGLYYQNHYDIDGFPRIAQSGNWGGFQSLFYKFLDQDLAIIILSNNASTFVWGLLDEIVAPFLGAEIAEASEKMNSNGNEIVEVLSLTKTEMEKFCGKYYNTGNGYLREIVLEDNRLLYKRVGANPTPLVAISSNELIYENAPQVKFTFPKNSFNSMVVSINNRGPTPYKKYKQHSYKAINLKEFENNYYNEDIDEVFQIVVDEKELQMLVKGEEVIRFKPVSIDLFTSEHSGYIVFERNKKNKITGFIRYDDILYNLKHTITSSVQ